MLWTYFSHFCLVVFLSSWYPRIFKIVWSLVIWKTRSFSFLLFVNIIQPFEKVTCIRLPSKEHGYFLSSNDYSYVIFNRCSSSRLIFSVSAYCYLPLIACYHVFWIHTHVWIQVHVYPWFHHGFGHKPKIYSHNPVMDKIKVIRKTNQTLIRECNK